MLSRPCTLQALRRRARPSECSATRRLVPHSLYAPGRKLNSLILEKSWHLLTCLALTVLGAQTHLIHHNHLCHFDIGSSSSCSFDSALAVAICALFYCFCPRFRSIDQIGSHQIHCQRRLSCFFFFRDFVHAHGSCGP